MQGQREGQREGVRRRGHSSASQEGEARTQKQDQVLQLRLSGRRAQQDSPALPHRVSPVVKRSRQRLADQHQCTEPARRSHSHTRSSMKHCYRPARLRHSSERKVVTWRARRLQLRCPGVPSPRVPRPLSLPNPVAVWASSATRTGSCGRTQGRCLDAGAERCALPSPLNTRPAEPPGPVRCLLLQGALGRACCDSLFLYADT